VVSAKMLKSACHNIPIVEMLALCRTDFGVAAVIPAIATIVVCSKVTIMAVGAMALHGTTWWNPSPTSGNQTSSALSLAIGKQRLSCSKALSLPDIGTRARVPSLSFAEIEVNRGPSAHWGITAVVAARTTTVEVSGPVTTALN